MRWMAACLLAAPACADPAVVVRAEASRAADGWRFDVTLRHAGTGWDDYADAWRIKLMDGTVLGIRELLHPHVEEQPFTRSLRGLIVPAGSKEVTVRDRTSCRQQAGPLRPDHSRRDRLRPEGPCRDLRALRAHRPALRDPQPRHRSQPALQRLGSTRSGRREWKRSADDPGANCGDAAGGTWRHRQARLPHRRARPLATKASSS